MSSGKVIPLFLNQNVGNGNFALQNRNHILKDRLPKPGYLL
ncbi:hypothetical protein LEP1GSC175_0930 [Leptospira santarosai str. HAI821]|nr:hypothetical protein LEP1GSC039_3766 [Leptospira santarosai str. 2000027870]EMO31549.1 hypothetical protein LEP1GSC175_0930 [Leptospira santarosai str. HAI821]